MSPVLVWVLACSLVVVASTNALAQTVNTECGAVRGVLDQQYGVAAFLGIPYAVPPVKSLRWQPAHPISRGGPGCWRGTLDATSFGAMCPQQEVPPAYMSEDCLFLNVWTPASVLKDKAAQAKNAGGGGLPVMFFIHGGSFVMGSGHLDGARFVNRSADQVVLVSINYRLNAFGFMALPELAQHDARQVSGNYGITDMVAALEWVRNNIANFGGDPSRVTIFGQSSGGTGVLMLLATPSAKGLFHRAISESGSTRVDMPLDDAYVQNRVFARNSNCSRSTDVYGCLLSLSPDQVLQALPWNEWPYFGHPTDMDLPIWEMGPGAMLGIVDGVTVPIPLNQALLAGLFNDVPTIIGSNEEEIDFSPAADLRQYSIPQFEEYIRKRFAAWGPDFGDMVLNHYDVVHTYGGSPQKAYETMASDIHVTCGQMILAKNAAMRFKSPVFHYAFGQYPSHPVPLNPAWNGTRAFHCLEMFMLLDDFSAYFPINYQPNEVDEKMGALMRHFWIYFAQHGNMPSDDGLARWWPINGNGVSWPADYNTYRLAVPPTAHRGWKRDECEFWDVNGFYRFTWNS